jgi:hypothetical protein
LRAELELLLNLNVWHYVKPEFEKITKEVNILVKKAKHIRKSIILLNKISSPLKVR